MPHHITIRLELLSDATFGEGQAAGGEVDTEVGSDPATGLPQMGGKAVKQRAAAGCATVLQSCSRWLKGGDHRWRHLAGAATALFGRPGSRAEDEGIAHFDSAGYPEAVRQLVAEAVRQGHVQRNAIFRATTILRTRTATDDETGAPLDGSLRRIRAIPRGTALYAPVRFGREPMPLELALLTASVRAGLQRAGLHKHRGSGRMRPSLVDAERLDRTEEWLTELQDLLVPHATALPIMKSHDPAADRIPAVAADAKSDDSDERYVLRVRLRPEQPLLIARLDSEPNSVVGEDHVPGSVMRGIAIQSFIREYELPPGADLAADDRARQLFFSAEKVRFLPAYPLAGGDRLVPAPLSLLARKDSDLATGAVVANFASSSPGRFGDDERGRDPDTAWKGIAPRFIGIAEDSVSWAPVERSAREHIRVDPIYERPRDGGMFVYDALAAEQSFFEAFESVVQCSNRAEATALAELLSGTFDVGRARHADYGRVTVAALDPEPAQDWAEVHHDSAGDGTFLTVWFLSDALIRAEDGEHRSDADTATKALGRALGQVGRPLDLELRAEFGAFLSAAPVGGYNRTWGHALPQQQAVRRGSVLVFKLPDCDKDELAARIKDLEWFGIGDRREEGFGRVVFGRLPEARYTLRRYEADQSGRGLPLPSPTFGEDVDSLLGIARGLLHSKLGDELLHRSRQVAEEILGKREGKKLSKSLVGRLRQVYRDAYYRPPAEGRADLVRELDRLTKKVRDEHLGGIRIQETTLFSWLKNRAAGIGTWQALGIGDHDLPRFGSYAPWPTLAELPARIQYHYDLRFAHDVLVRVSHGLRAADTQENIQSEAEA